jgi:hypothetical protein
MVFFRLENVKNIRKTHNFLVSPAGAAVGLPLNEAEAYACFVNDLPLDTKKPSLAAAYARARGLFNLGFFKKRTSRRE